MIIGGRLSLKDILKVVEFNLLDLVFLWVYVYKIESILLSTNHLAIAFRYPDHKKYIFNDIYVY